MDEKEDFKYTKSLISFTRKRIEFLKRMSILIRLQIKRSRILLLGSKGFNLHVISKIKVKNLIKILKIIKVNVDFVRILLPIFYQLFKIKDKY